MSRESILLIGAGGHAAACIDVIELESRFVIAGLVGTAPEVGRRLLGYEVLGADDRLADLAAHHPCMLVAVGQIKTADVRKRLFAQLMALKCVTPVVISPRAYVSPHAVVGAGTIVMHGAVVNAGAVIGSNCIVNSHALIEHDCAIGDHCHVATRATLNGGVRVGEGTFIGSGACVRESVCIGARSLIGMGERVLRDCPSETRMPVSGGGQAQ